MKNVAIYILLISTIVGWLFFFAERNSKPKIIGVPIRDSIWLPYEIQPKQPKPVMLQGKTDTVESIDWVAVDSIARKKADSLALVKYLAQSFRLSYEDSIQKTSVDIFPATKQGLFTPFYKKQRIFIPEIHQTTTVDNERWLRIFLGAGYVHRDSSQFHFFLDADIRVREDLYVTPNVTTDGFGVKLKYKIY